jgi:hypothetical protein
MSRVNNTKIHHPNKFRSSEANDRQIGFRNEKRFPILYKHGPSGLKANKSAYNHEHDSRLIPRQAIAKEYRDWIESGRCIALFMPARSVSVLTKHPVMRRQSRRNLLPPPRNDFQPKSFRRVISQRLDGLSITVFDGTLGLIKFPISADVYRPKSQGDCHFAKVRHVDLAEEKGVRNQMGFVRLRFLPPFLLSAAKSLSENPGGF